MDKKLIFFIALSLFLFLLVTGLSFATEFKSGRNIFVRQTKTIEDDLIIAANNVRIGGVVQGDVIFGSRSLVHNGKITGSLNGACQNVRILGEVGGSVRAFCQNNNIEGTIGRNLINFSQTLNIRPSGKINGDVTSFCAEMTIDGEVGRNVKCGAGTVIISGTIHGDVNLEADEISIMPTAKILGDFKYKSREEARVEQGAQVTGEVEWIKLEPKEKEKKGFLTTKNIIIKLLFLLAAIVTGLILLGISKNFVRGAKRAVTESFLKSLGLGFICLVCIPIAVVILLITVIGIPVAIISLFVYLILFYISKIFVGIAFGEKILTGFKKGKEAPLGWSLIVGLIIINILTSIPYLGWIVCLAVLFIGFGAALLARKHLLA